MRPLGGLVLLLSFSGLACRDFDTPPDNWLRLLEPDAGDGPGTAPEEDHSGTESDGGAERNIHDGRDVDASILADASTGSDGRDPSVDGLSPHEENAAAASDVVGSEGPPSGAMQPGDAGEAVVDEEPECEMHAECIDRQLGNAAICREGECVPLVNDECPLVIGAGANWERLNEPDVIVLGAYAPIDSALTHSDQALSYQLAIEELNGSSLGGLPGGRDGTRRPFVGVVCRDDADVITTSIHLVDDVNAPVLLAALDSEQLLTLVEARQGKRRAVLINPGQVDSAVFAADRGNVTWHLMGSPSDLTPTYAALVRRLEAHMREEATTTDAGTSTGSENVAPIAPGGSMTIAVVVDDSEQLLVDLGTEVLNGLEFNGVDALQNVENLHLDIMGWKATSTRPLDTDRLQTTTPNVVFLLLQPASVGRAIAEIESALGDASPFYVLGPHLLGASETLIAIESSGIAQRALGVSWADDGDASVLQGYLSRYTGAHFNLRAQLEGAPASYDAAYYAMYAMAASVSAAPRTNEIGAGLLRLGAGEQTFAVGPSAVSSILAHLNQDDRNTLVLSGCTGTTTFDTSTRVRRMPSRVWCVRSAQDGIQFAADELSYDAASDSVTGSTQCVPGF